ncbi:hypothetical protein [Lelliottia wanjuensis]|uniref:Uncharacterized protein n=1 Tax=Lelliottia wanjuensis TaxID=3050585 RepID=A0AAP4FSI6_9ENTR|nr:MULTISPECIES: hypothetical protein [unclassified Lelliottia]MDK9362916.1 hypothetical protein [Lelliottia sp. V106_12]MDK9616599.1 hypothetical protein [Lelliottia sp. V106_9]
MKERIKIAYLCLLFPLCFKAMAAETTVMQCQLTNGSEVNVQWNGSSLSYSYGKPGAKPELALSGDKAHFGHESFASSEAAYYRFSSGKYDYVTYFSETNQGTISNLGIFKDKKLIKQVKCKDYFHSQLSSLYQPVSPTIPVDDGTVDWSVNEDESASTGSFSQAENQYQQQIPIKIEVKDLTTDRKYGISATHDISRHIYIYSLVDSVTIKEVIIDRGSCYNWKNKSYTIAYGKRLDFHLSVDNQTAYANNGWTWYQTPGKRYNQCMWSEIEVKTDKGDWTFNLK